MSSPRAQLRAFLVARFQAVAILRRFVGDHFEGILPELRDDSLLDLADTFIGALTSRGRIPELWPPLLEERGQFADEIERLKAAFGAAATAGSIGAVESGKTSGPDTDSTTIGARGTGSGDDLMESSEPGAELPLAPQAHGSAPGTAPRSECPDPAMQTLADQLAAAHSERKRLICQGTDTTEVDARILELRRRIREGGRLRVGDFLLDGRYQLLQALKQGGFGTIYRAWDEREQRLVAIKVLHGQHGDDRSRVERFFRGAQQMARLQHQGIVQVLDPRQTDEGHHFFVMEYLPGGDLRDAVHDGALSEKRVFELILRVGETLSFTHARGLVHRDVKPANIVLDGDGRPKLTDFDLVRAGDTTGGTRTGMLGTFVYAAPEMMQRPQDADARADVFGLGMTAVFLLLGSDPDFFEVMVNRDGLIERLPIAAGVKPVLARAIARQADERFDSVAAFCDALTGARLGSEQEAVNDLTALPASESGNDGGQERLEPSTPLTSSLSASSEPIPFRDRFIDGSGEGPEMVWLPGGTFRMGSLEGVGHDRERPAHNVTLSQYGVGKYPVTVGEFRRFVEATGYVTYAEQTEGHFGDKTHAGPSWREPGLHQDDRHPVVYVTWNDAKAYCEWLIKETGQRYGLLTEAQWEHACRAGNDAAYCFGDDEARLADYGWYGRNAGDGTCPVGGKSSNHWGLCDMHGNCWEWCEDWYGIYPGQPQQDPSGPESGSNRVIRGGSWDDGAGYCRSACRDDWRPSFRYDFLGFRLSRTGPRDSYPFALGPAQPAEEARADEGRAQSRETGPAPRRWSAQEVFRDRFRIVRSDGTEGQIDAPDLVYLPGGTFEMGDEQGLDWEKPVHRVHLDAFAIGRTPVTWGDYRRFCEATGTHWPEWLERGSQYHLETGSDDYYRKRGIAADALDLPVVGISWEDAASYCAWLSTRTGERYALPTEAQWEYACRAGTCSRWSCGDDEGALGDHAWYAANAGGKVHPVSGKRPNDWGLYDMHGNVWEWCADWYREDFYRQLAKAAEPLRSSARESSGRLQPSASKRDQLPSKNPSGPELGSDRVFRGGSWDNVADDCRSAYRDGGEPALRHDLVGFRLSRSV